MDKKTIDKIAWWIPIKKYRKLFREKMYANIMPDSVINYNKKVFEIFNRRKITLIQLETHNRCNNNCQFCPVSVGNDKRKYSRMTYDLFMKIMNDLNEINYNGCISLFDNNEPFLDDRIVDFFRIAKDKLPNAFHYIMTNGLVLTLDKFIESYKYLDMLLIDNYNNNGELNDKTKIIYDYCLNNKEYQNKTVILMRRKDEVLSTRAGNSPNRQESLKKVQFLCALPMYRIHIRPDGKISLCCNDAWGQMTLGDINRNSISEIFNSNIRKKICKKLLKGRNRIKMCKYCDFVENASMIYEDVVNNKRTDWLAIFKSYKNNILPDQTRPDQTRPDQTRPNM